MSTNHEYTRCPWSPNREQSSGESAVNGIVCQTLLWVRLGTLGSRSCDFWSDYKSEGVSFCPWCSETGDQDAALICNRWLRCWDLGFSASSKEPILWVHLCILFLPASLYRSGDVEVTSCLEASQRPAFALICASDHCIYRKAHLKCISCILLFKKTEASSVWTQEEETDCTCLQLPQIEGIPLKECISPFTSEF